jgi:hypothetical protein
MNLDDTQKLTVTRWINEGAKLAEIQNRLASEFNLRLTYMEVRMLVDDLKLTPKDQEPAKPAAPILPDRAPAAPGAKPGADTDTDLPADEEQELPGATPSTGVKVSLDHVTRPGSVVSGQVTFSDGKSAQWYLDQYGRLGLAPQQKGYKPSDIDLQAFQVELQNELQKMGY